MSNWESSWFPPIPPNIRPGNRRPNAPRELILGNPSTYTEWSQAVTPRSSWSATDDVPLTYEELNPLNRFIQRHRSNVQTEMSVMRAERRSRTQQAQQRVEQARKRRQAKSDKESIEKIRKQIHTLDQQSNTQQISREEADKQIKKLKKKLDVLLGKPSSTDTGPRGPKPKDKKPPPGGGASMLLSGSMRPSTSIFGIR